MVFFTEQIRQPQPMKILRYSKKGKFRHRAHWGRAGQLLKPLDGWKSLRQHWASPPAHKPVLRHPLVTFGGALEAIDTIGRPSADLGLHVEKNASFPKVARSELELKFSVCMRF